MLHLECSETRPHYNTQRPPQMASHKPTWQSHGINGCDEGSTMQWCSALIQHGWRNEEGTVEWYRYLLRWAVMLEYYIAVQTWERFLTQTTVFCASSIILIYQEVWIHGNMYVLEVFWTRNSKRMEIFSIFSWRSTLHKWSKIQISVQM